ncbi:MAG: glycosyltransferase family 2 protein [Eubacteriales bacterium]|nr:glycosyltransferase family 2 protein [Eubacteriales bacterium]
MITYNGLAFLPAQVASILDQLSDQDELVISDDGSSDGTWAFLTDLAHQDPRVRLLRNEGRPGIIGNFDHALQHCRGEIIFLSDQDDLWYPGKVTRLSEALSGPQKPWLVQSDAELIDADGQVTAPSFYALRHSRPGFWANFWRNTYQGCTLAFRRELLEIALPLPATVPMHDMWMGLLAELSGQVRFIPDRLTGYRRHGDNQSALTPRALGQVLAWRIQLGLALAGRCLVRLSTIQKLRRMSHGS